MTNAVIKFALIMYFIGLKDKPTLREQRAAQLVQSLLTEQLVTLYGLAVLKALLTASWLLEDELKMSLEDKSADYFKAQAETLYAMALTSYDETFVKLKGDHLSKVVFKEAIAALISPSTASPKDQLFLDEQASLEKVG